VSLVNFHDDAAATQPATASSIVSLTLYDASFNEVAVNDTAVPSLGAGFAPLRIRLPGAIVDASPPPVCRFWDESAAAWSTDGCVADVSCGAGGGVFCACTHLTDFQVATFVDDDEKSMPAWVIALIVTCVVTVIALTIFAVVRHRRLKSQKIVAYNDESAIVEEKKVVDNAAVLPLRSQVTLQELKTSSLSSPRAHDPEHHSRIHPMLPRFLPNFSMHHGKVVVKPVPCLATALEINHPAFSSTRAPVKTPLVLPKAFPDV
jgi:hypothetical protein